MDGYPSFRFKPRDIIDYKGTRYRVLYREETSDECTPSLRRFNYVLMRDGAVLPWRAPHWLIDRNATPPPPPESPSPHTPASDARTLTT